MSRHVTRWSTHVESTHSQAAASSGGSWRPCSSCDTRTSVDSCPQRASSTRPRPFRDGQILEVIYLDTNKEEHALLYVNIPEPSKELNFFLVVWPRSNSRKNARDSCFMLFFCLNTRATPGTVYRKIQIFSLCAFCARVREIALVVRTFLGSPNLQSVMAQRAAMNKRSFSEICSFLTTTLE